MRIIAEREHYLLVSDGKRFTVVERRAGKFYPLCNGIRHGCDLNDEGVAELVRESGSFPKGKDADVSPTLLGDGATYSNTSDEPEHRGHPQHRGCAEDNSHSRVLSGRWPSWVVGQYQERD